MAISTNLKNILSNAKYVIFSNLISLLISCLVILIIPNIIGVEDYGYWQLYLFYASYIGFFHLGWIDGIYLRYGGEYYEQLDKDKFFSQFILLLLSQLFISLIFLLYVTYYIVNLDKAFIINVLSITLITTNLRFFLIYVLQTTNRIKESSFITIADRAIYVLLLALLILSNYQNYQVMIWADVIARILSLFIATYYCKDIVLRNFKNLKIDLRESLENIKVGINLMFSNIASMLIIGIVRFSIENRWNIETFGKVSLTLSISNLLMLFVNAIGVVLFPILKRMNPENMQNIFSKIRRILIYTTLGMMLVYYPLKVILELILPSYKDSLAYMAILFPLTIYEGKMALLINPYLKALRLEKKMLQINMIVMLISLVVTLLNIIWIYNLDFAIFSIVILLILRASIFELILADKLNVNIKIDLIIEIIVVSVFILGNIFLSMYEALLAYLASYLGYILLKQFNKVYK